MELMKKSNDGYRLSHMKNTVVQNYSNIYSGFREGFNITDRFSYARWLIEKEELSAYFNQLSEKLTGLNYLDFACGTGRLLSFLENFFQKPVGVDISEEMLNIARRTCKNSQLLCADITSNNVLDGQLFDIVTAFRFFLRAENSLREAVFGKIYELLSDNGLFIFNVHDNKFSMNWPLYLFSLISGKESPVPGPFDLGTRPFFQDGLVSAMLKRNGFQIEKVVHLGIVPNFLYGLPVFTSLYYKLDLLMYKHQLLKTIAVERIYYCKKIT